MGWNSFVSPFQTGTPAYWANSSTIACPKPRYSIPVKHPPQNPSGICDGFFLANLRARGGQVSGVHSQVMGRNLKGTAGTGRGLFKNQRNVFAIKIIMTLAVFFLPLEVRCQIQQILNLLRSKNPIVLENFCLSDSSCVLLPCFYSFFFL